MKVGKRFSIMRIGKRVKNHEGWQKGSTIMKVGRRTTILKIGKKKGQQPRIFSKRSTISKIGTRSKTIEPGKRLATLKAIKRFSIMKIGKKSIINHNSWKKVHQP